jgi:hypothetical protein
MVLGIVVFEGFLRHVWCERIGGVGQLRQLVFHIVSPDGFGAGVELLILACCLAR